MKALLIGVAVIALSAVTVMAQAPKSAAPAVAVEPAIDELDAMRLKLLDAEYQKLEAQIQILLFRREKLREQYLEGVAALAVKAKVDLKQGWTPDLEARKWAKTAPVAAPK